MVKALELLDEMQVEQAVILAPAVSPAYDLSCASGPCAARWLFSGLRLTFSCSGLERSYSEQQIASGPPARVWSASVCPQQEET